jgi:hypothetical protein
VCLDSMRAAHLHAQPVDSLVDRRQYEPRNEVALTVHVTKRARDEHAHGAKASDRVYWVFVHAGGIHSLRRRCLVRSDDKTVLVDRWVTRRFHAVSRRVTDPALRRSTHPLACWHWTADTLDCTHTNLKQKCSVSSGQLLAGCQILTDFWAAAAAVQIELTAEQLPLVNELWLFCHKSPR